MRAAALRSGKGARGENFPVASWLIARRHRPLIQAFYEFVRVADDIADHPTLAAGEKVAALDSLEASVKGHGVEPEGLTLAALLRSRGLSSSHAEALLRAFRQDVFKHRYADWNELIEYCSLSAMPVGRFVLDVHGEARACWPLSDALCAALQIINHLQDCRDDYRRLNRVYIPADALAARDIGPEELGKDCSSPALRDCLRDLAQRTCVLLRQSEGLAACVSDTRLAMEIAAIQALAARLIDLLQKRDPLSQQVRLPRSKMLLTAIDGVARASFWRSFRRTPKPRSYQLP